MCRTFGNISGANFCYKVNVQYLGTVRIRFHITSDNLIEEANATVATKQ